MSWKEAHPPRGQAAIPPARGVNLVMLRPHSHPVRAGPTPYTGGARLQGVQRSVSLEYQTSTSAYLFDTLVTGMAWSARLVWWPLLMCIRPNIIIIIVVVISIDISIS